MKRLKCIKCGISFKDRQDPEEERLVYKDMCFNCRYVWKTLGMFIQSFGFINKLKRKITINLDDIKIEKMRDNTKVSFQVKK